MLGTELGTFTCVIPFNPPCSLTMPTLLFPFCTVKNWGSEKLKGLFSFTHLLSQGLNLSQPVSWPPFTPLYYLDDDLFLDFLNAHLHVPGSFNDVLFSIFDAIPILNAVCEWMTSSCFSLSTLLTHLTQHFLGKDSMTFQGSIWCLLCALVTYTESYLPY